MGKINNKSNISIKEAEKCVSANVRYFFISLVIIDNTISTRGYHHSWKLIIYVHSRNKNILHWQDQISSMFFYSNPSLYMYIVADSPFVRIDGPKTYNITEGDFVKLTCKVDSKPASNIKWYHNKTLLSERTPMDNVHILTIEPIKRKHYGIYYCKASNNIGEETYDQVFIGVKCMYKYVVSCFHIKHQIIFCFCFFFTLVFS